MALRSIRSVSPLSALSSDDDQSDAGRGPSRRLRGLSPEIAVESDDETIATVRHSRSARLPSLT